jgi:hypothetical protein
MTGDETGNIDEARLAPLLSLVERLRGEVTELPGRWEALGEELEAKRGRLRLAEATLELMKRREEEAAPEEQGEGPAGGVVPRAEGGAQASVGTPDGPLRGRLLTFWLYDSWPDQVPGDSLAGDKRSRPSAPGAHEEECSRLSLVTALPPSVWQEHLRPLLSRREAARLRVVCMALKVLVMKWPMELIGLKAARLEAALTCFPATEELYLYADADGPLEPAAASALVEVLTRRGAAIKRVLQNQRQLFSPAVRAGALPNLTRIDLYLWDPNDRHILSEGMLRLLEEVEITMGYGEGTEGVAALEQLRSLPHLRRIRLDSHKPLSAAFPPFIPPSLKSLSVHVFDWATLAPLLRELPSMLQASGARLESIGLSCALDSDPLESPPEEGAAIARVLRVCSSTLKTVALLDHGMRLSRTCIHDLMPGLTSCCDTLEVLHCPWAVFCSLPATGPCFPRLTKLHVGGSRVVIDLVMPGWGAMANGRLPALASLDMQWMSGLLEVDEVEGEEAEYFRVARAFEGVAGTLTRLTLNARQGVEPAEGACHELGTAIGKLRRLRYLHLDLFSDGRDYAEMARGVAASGGCPELFRLSIDENNLIR